MLAMKAYRDRGRERDGIAEPQVVLPATAHAAFDKAARFFGIETVAVPVGEDFRADVGAIREAIGERTVAVVGSAPSFPHGVIDPIEELSELARERGVGFHTDACLGGFLLPFAERLGHDVPPFDFRLPGVTSMSADTHKFGYAAKGTSVVLYRGNELRHAQYFTLTDWPGGLYMSPTFAGSRPGALSAACWAAMTSLGERWYLESASRILEAAATIRRGIEETDGLRVLGDPLFCIAFVTEHDELAIYRVMDAMTARGWSLNGLHRPPAVSHLHDAAPHATRRPRALRGRPPGRPRRGLRESRQLLGDGPGLRHGGADPGPHRGGRHARRLHGSLVPGLEAGPCSLDRMATSSEQPASSSRPVIVGYNGRPEGGDALALGAALAQAFRGPVVVASIYPADSVLSPIPAAELRSEAERTAGDGPKRLPDDVEADPLALPAESPARGLHELAEDRHAAAIVVGSSHRGALGRVLAGTGATQLLSGSSCPVAVAPRGLADGAPIGLRRIGVGFDDSPESWNALQRAAGLAAATGAAVRVVHALAPLSLPPSLSPAPSDVELDRRRAAELATARAVASLSQTVKPESRFLTGHPVSALEAEARGDLDLLVLGSRGFGPLRRVLLGSVSAELMRQAPCAVMVVPRSVEFDPGGEGMAGGDAP
jgi:nucleotide-binding universal stress UspA family protein